MLPVQVLRGHPRLFAGIAVSLLAGVLSPDSVRLATRLLFARSARTRLYFIAAAIKVLSGTINGLHIGLAAATIVSAWFFMHLPYAFHDAHEYCGEYFAEPAFLRRRCGG
ncbi:MAG: hypothetical protein ACREDJ_00995 [Methylocella sp.]